MLAIFLDTESTGLNCRRHHILEIAFKVISMSSGGLVGSYQSVIAQPYAAWQNRDLSSIEINGFTWEEVSRGKEATVVAQEIVDMLTSLHIERRKAVFICQNPAFDRAFFSQLVDLSIHEKLQWPYHWLDFASMYWVLRCKECMHKGIAFPEQMSLSKNDIAKEYNIAPEEHPHRAMNGVDHLLLCYKTVIGFP